MGSQLSSATAYVPSSLLHVQLYSPVPMRFVSAHRQLSSGSHVVGSHPLTASVGFRLFPYGSHCSPTAESNAPLPHVGGGGGLGGGLGGDGGGAASAGIAVTSIVCTVRIPIVYRLFTSESAENVLVTDEPDPPDPDDGGGVSACATLCATPKSRTLTVN